MKLSEINVDATFTDEEVEILYQLLAKYISYSNKCKKEVPETQYELMLNNLIQEHISYATNIQELLLAQT